HVRQVLGLNGGDVGKGVETPGAVEPHRVGVPAGGRGGGRVARGWPLLVRIGEVALEDDGTGLCRTSGGRRADGGLRPASGQRHSDDEYKGDTWGNRQVPGLTSGEGPRGADSRGAGI